MHLHARFVQEEPWGERDDLPDLRQGNKGRFRDRPRLCKRCFEELSVTGSPYGSYGRQQELGVSRQYLLDVYPKGLYDFPRPVSLRLGTPSELEMRLSTDSR